MIEQLNKFKIKAVVSLIFYFLLNCAIFGQNEKAQIFTSDIDNFWQAFDSVQTSSDMQKQIQLMQTLYIDKGTEGLKAFMDLRNFDAERLVKTINQYPNFWKSIRPNTYLVKEKEAEINKYLKKFYDLYPSYREAKIYFTITSIRSGGTTKDSVVLVGTEIATGNKNTDVSEFPDKRLETFFKNQEANNIVPFTIHEYVHTQQKREGNVLLGQAIAEGACDFIAEVVLETKLQHAYLTYGRKNEQRLKAQFKEEMFSEDFTNWLYNGTTTETVGDLGYFMGYAICRSYYNKATNKKKAIAEIIELDYGDIAEIKVFLEKSGYY